MSKYRITAMWGGLLAMILLAGAGVADADDRRWVAPLATPMLPPPLENAGENARLAGVQACITDAIASGSPK